MGHKDSEPTCCKMLLYVTSLCPLLILPHLFGAVLSFWHLVSWGPISRLSRDTPISSPLGLDTDQVDAVVAAAAAAT